jgi:HSP20 family molecular chaperone IbpA
MIKKLEISNENKRYARELRNLQSAHKEYTDKVKANQADGIEEVHKLNRKDLVDVRTGNNKVILDEVTRKDERINELKNNYKKTTEKLNKELDIFKTTKADQLSNEKTIFEERFSQNRSNQLGAMNKTYGDHTEALKELNIDASNDKLAALETNQKVIQGISEAHSNKYYETKDTNVKEMQYLRDEHIDNYYNVKSGNDRDLASLARLHGTRYENTRESQQAERDKLVTNHQAQKKETHKSFEKEYGNLITENHIKVDTLDSRTKGVVNKIKERFLQNANLILEKSKDPFYQFKRIKPDIEDKGDHYDLSFKIPEHEKNLVQISGKKRNLKLTFSRLHQETFNDVENVQNIAKKYESYSTTTKVKDIVDADKIEKSYTNNKLHFKIPKA